MTLCLFLTERMEAAIQGITTAKEFWAEKDQKIAEKVKAQSTKKRPISRVLNWHDSFEQLPHARSMEMGTGILQ